MSNISNVGKIAYIYDELSDTWHPVYGMVDTSENISWTGNHTFSSSSSIIVGGSMTASKGVNNFSSTVDRDAKIPSPTNGTLAMVSVNSVIQPQYYNDGSWRLIGSNALVETRTSTNFVSGTTNYVVQMSDAGKTLLMNHTAAHTIQIPTNATTAFPIGSQIAFIWSGTGQPAFAPVNSTVTLGSKLNNRKLSLQYSQAILVKTGINSWLLMGDLIA